MYDEQKPSKDKLAPALVALEKQLRGLTLAAPRVDRDNLMFAAGHAAGVASGAETGQDRRAVDLAGSSWAAHRFWPAATLTMTAATLLLATMLVWQRQTLQVASQGAAPVSTKNQASDQPLMAIAPPPDESTTSSFGSPAFQRPSSGYLGIRYAALTLGVSAWRPSSQASVDDGGSYNETPRTQRKMLEEFLPSPKHQINPRS